MPEVKVKVKVSNERLQLVYSYQGKRHYLSLGLSANAVNQRIAELKAAEIEQDFLFDRFKGKAYYAPGLQQPLPVNQESISLADLWAAYINHKRTYVRESTIVGHRAYTNLVNRCPFDVDDGVKIQKWLASATTPQVAKTTLDNLKRMAFWAVKEGLITNNSFADLQHQKIKIQRNYQSINPFTAPERDQIIDVFKTYRNYDYYAPLVEFMFFLGCRPCEAIALRWSDISKDLRVLTFVQSGTRGLNSKTVIAEGLKTQPKRRINLNDRLSELLQRQQSKQLDSIYVFPSVNMQPINWAYFSCRPWVICLKQLPEIDYRKPYEMRHTFITLALRAGMPVADIAAIVGNSAEIIYKHYAGVSRDLIVPDL
jgi:integrase